MKQWFRWYRDTVADTKLRLAHAQVEDFLEPGMIVTHGDVIAAWAALMERCDDNGRVTVQSSLRNGANVCRYLSVTISVTEEQARLILDAMRSHGLISETDSAVTVPKWKQRQYLDETNAARQARHRERARNGGNNGARNGEVTHRQRQNTETEKKERETRPIGRTLPPDWKPTTQDLLWASTKGYTQTFIDEQTEALHSWAKANASRAIAKKSDWSQAWQGWCRREWPHWQRQHKVDKVTAFVPRGRVRTYAEIKAEREGKP